MTDPHVIHSLDEARVLLKKAVARESKEITLISAHLAAAHGGALWFKALTDAAQKEFPSVVITSILDCGGHPGLVLEGLRAGLKHLRVDPHIKSFDTLEDLARQNQAVLHRKESNVKVDL